MKFIKQVTLLLLISFCFVVSAQDHKAFYRLTIVNEQGQLLVVKIKEPGVWVTTGVYATPDTFSFDQFHTMAATYGLDIKDIRLQGNFQVSPARDKPFQTRYFYQAIATNEVQKTPDFIEEVQWLAPEVAYERITFPHITHLTKQTLNHPQQVWWAKVQRYTQNGEHKLQILEGFHVKSGALSTTSQKP